MAHGAGMSGTSRSERPIGAAHIFCDESGGSDGANTAFLAAAVAILPADAQRLVKSFRKATRIGGEIKGHRLTPEQRSIFFDLLTKRVEVVSAVMTCSRLDLRGGWAMSSLPEVTLYSHLLAEACVALPGLTTASHLAVTPDGGRYKKMQLDPVRRHLSQVLAAQHPHTKISVGFNDSTALPGLQVADVIANSVFHSLGTTASAEATKRLLAPLTARGSLLIHSVRLERIRPRWLDEL